MSFLLLICVCSQTTAGGPGPLHKSDPHKYHTVRMAGPASGVDITWAACTSGTTLASSTTATASYTFGPSDCDGNGFTAYTDLTAAASNTDPEVRIVTVAGTKVLGFDRTISGGAPYQSVADGRLKSTAGDHFQLTNLTILPNSVSSTQTITVTAYLAGVAVSGSTITLNYTPPTTPPTHGFTLTSTDFGSYYNNIDEIELTTTTAAGVGITNIKTASPVSLPLTLTNFTGQLNGNSVLLNWTTSAEENTSHFEIQRSTSASATYTSIGKVAAAGNSTATLHYQYVDILPQSPAAEYFYRLQMVDIDGNFTYSPIIEVSPPPQSLTMSVAPNPFQQQVVITVMSPGPDNATFTLTDMSGRIITIQASALQKGSNTITLRSLSQLANGVYLLNMSTKSQTQTIKLSKN